MNSFSGSLSTWDIFCKLVLHLSHVLHFRSFTGILLLVMFWLEKEKPVKLQTLEWPEMYKRKISMNERRR